MTTTPLWSCGKAAMLAVALLAGFASGCIPVDGDKATMVAPSSGDGGLPMADLCGGAGDMVQPVVASVDMAKPASLADMAQPACDLATPPPACGGNCSGGRQCVNGACQCPPGLTWCGSSCVDLTKDDENCGACDNLCSGGNLHCVDSQCKSSCGGGAPCEPGQVCVCALACSTDDKNGGVCATVSRCEATTCEVKKAQVNSPCGGGCYDGKNAIVCHWSPSDKGVAIPPWCLVNADGDTTVQGVELSSLLGDDNDNDPKLGYEWGPQGRGFRKWNPPPMCGKIGITPIFPK